MCSSMLRTAACLLLLLSATAASELGERRGELVCPAVCTCHVTPRNHVPLVRWHETGDRDDETQHHWDYYHHHQSLNHTSSDDGDGDDEDQETVLSAVCVLRRDTDAAQLMAELSSDTQFLSLLQAPDMQPTYLRAEEFSGLTSLQGLEIQGFHRHEEYHHDQAAVGDLHGNDIASMLARADLHRGLNRDRRPQPSLVTLSEDALHRLKQLQYVNLEYVLLSPERAGPQGPQYRSETVQSAAAGDAGPAVHTLLVEQPAEVVPYHQFRLHTAPRYSNFANLTQLRFLRVAHAHLEEITWQLFQGLPALRHLIVEHQRLTSLPDFAFYGCPNLRRLSLANNQLTVDMKSFAGLLDLETLDLSNNLISQLTYFSLAPFPQLRELNLLDNPTDLVFAGAFDMMNQTEVLRLGGADTPLAIIPHAFDQLTALRELTVVGLNMMTLQQAQFSALPQLVSLEIHGNIERLEFDAFSGNTNLERLDLSNCSLREISQDALMGLTRLTVLDLSYNHLTELPADLLSSATALREVYLHHNRLSWLSPRLLADVTPKLLQLHHNPWECSCELAFLRATMTNKVRSSRATVCRWDSSAPGGRTCEHEHRSHLRYDARLEPRCHSPAQYRHWGLYEVLQGELRCRRRAGGPPPPPAARGTPYHPVTGDGDDPDYTLEVVAADDVVLLDDRADFSDEPEQYEDYAEAAVDQDQMAEYVAGEYEYADGYDDYTAAYSAGSEEVQDGQVVLTAHGAPTQPEKLEEKEQPFVTISPELFARLSRKAQKLELERMNPKFRKFYNL